ncbi:MAG TPA: hypothetical protein VF331_25120 [Polyangiales bacterium]
MKRFALVLGVAACVSVLALWSSPRVQADGPTCGEKGLPDCPLQGWMAKNMDDPLDRGDLKALAVAFEKSAALVPDPAWNDGPTGWTKIAQTGAELAKKGDSVGTKGQCKACHKAWRSKYKQSYRMRTVP